MLQKAFVFASAFVDKLGVYFRGFFGTAVFITIFFKKCLNEIIPVAIALTRTVIEIALFPQFQAWKCHKCNHLPDTTVTLSIRLIDSGLVLTWHSYSPWSLNVTFLSLKVHAWPSGVEAKENRLSGVCLAKNKSILGLVLYLQQNSLLAAHLT